MNTEDITNTLDEWKYIIFTIIAIIIMVYLYMDYKIKADEESEIDEDLEDILDEFNA